MKFLCLIILTMGLVFSANAKEMKVGWIDMQKAIQSSNAGKSAKRGLESEFKRKKAKLESKQKNLKKMSEDLQKKKLALSDKAFMEKQQNLQKEFMKFQEEYRKSQLEIQKKESQLTKPILAKIQKAISTIAKEKGYSYVLEKSEQSVMWAKKDLDITDIVIKKINK